MKVFFRNSYIALAFILIASVLFSSFISTGCKKKDDDAPWYQGPPLYIVAFDEVAESIGFSGVTARYVAWGDYDGNGFEDLILDGRRLFKNNGDGTFTETTVAAGIDPAAGGEGAAWADFDNDGDLDLFCSGYQDASLNSADRLYENNAGVFTDITASAGVSDSFYSRACSWGDFDGDGNLDLYVANYETVPGNGIRAADKLYKYNGSLPFVDISVSSGIAAASTLAGRAVVCCDYNMDGYLDIYVANGMNDSNFLWKNNGSAVFTNEAFASEVEGTDEGGGLFGLSTGASWGDFDNDMDFDLLVTNRKSAVYHSYEDNSAFYVNFGVITFTDWYPISFINTDSGALCPAWFDYNNDTQQDFFVCSDQGWGQLYNGHGSGAFINIAPYVDISAFKPLGCAIADYNNDGRPDIFLCAADRVYLYQNNHDQYNWLKVKLVGTATNSSGIGSVVRVTCPCTTPDTISRQISGSNGTGCQDSLIGLFGMGNHATPYTVDIIWSDSTSATSQLTGQAINQLHVITQP